jgi:hypothetical protein
VGETFALGTSGAGYGAMAGGLKGGLGSASCVASDGFTVGAIVAVNSMGSTVLPGTRQFWAAPFEIGNEFGGVTPLPMRVGPEEWGHTKGAAARENTTIACIATDLDLTADEMKRVAIMAQDGLARAIRPVHPVRWRCRLRHLHGPHPAQGTAHDRRAQGRGDRRRHAGPRHCPRRLCRHPAARIEGADLVDAACPVRPFLVRPSQVKDRP